ncbi:Multiple RNA-binding domain-containing protein 1 [Tulasnella sp. 403]|nr:Multiple RNA-binding domain-containing protein 1 [Tulasnella sp. 403]
MRCFRWSRRSWAKSKQIVVNVAEKFSSFLSPMSRLIVKNLPPYLTADGLRNHFEKAHLGTITDARVATKQDGRSRRFGFIGFKTSEDATRAKEYFDGTFLDTARLQVEVVTKERLSVVRPAKRPRTVEPEHAAGPSQPRDRDTDPSNSAAAKKQEAQYAKFLELMGSGRSKARAWENTEVSNQEQNAKEPRNSDAPVDASAEPVSDADWLRTKMKSTSLSDEALEGQAFYQDEGEPRNEPGPEPEPKQEPLDRDQATEPFTGRRLFLRNLTFTCTEEDLAAQFADYGTIEQVHVVGPPKIHIPLDQTTKKSKGKSCLAYITYATNEEALAAYEALDGSDFQGRLLHIIPATDKVEARPTPFKNKPFKEGASEKRKEGAGKEFNWATLYMNVCPSYIGAMSITDEHIKSDAVASSIADRLNISKSDILNSDTDTANPAVKLALAETQIIQETKQYLTENGVNLDAFGSTRTARSSTVILVKNIPYGTAVSDLRQLFAPHGEISRLLMAPAGTMAVVEFGHANDARSAFRGVSYRRMKNSIIYLEWAPSEIFAPGPEPAEAQTTTRAAEPGTSGVATDNVNAPTSSQDTASESGSVLYVKNLNFSTTKKDLRDLFGAHGTVKSVRMPRKFDTKARGFAFVDFASRREAENVMASLKHTHLLGRHLVLEWAKEGETVDVDELREKIKKGYVEDGKQPIGRKRKFRMEDGNEEDDGLGEEPE